MKTPLKVLTLGSNWDRLDQAFTFLSSQGIVEFVGPADRGIHDAVALERPSVIMISPGYDAARQALLERRPVSPDRLPPVLLCLDHDSLETDELYEYADDFLLVPSSAAEIQKRLGRLVLGKPPELPAHMLQLGTITLDTRIYEVRVAQKRVELAWMEFQLLRFMMENSGRIFTRDELLTNVWSVDTFGGTRTVDVHIRRLRQKLGLHGNTYIRTVANVGYGLVDV
ncbi:MAG: winged helix-turn-helix domain-containing protein [Chloroflexi bacterium]|nr:winged helix-turn-helix domain-containing protein [Chloroflexota bacterium]MDA1271524.1 winged helix-turn-helix domain-containing protein [Chloroflexota bacterium]PKB58536.1 MAG: hypothetical protein BZY83_06540 [SAR202 cluster bacterium Casp-Chloro-G2]